MPGSQCPSPGVGVSFDAETAHSIEPSDSGIPAAPLAINC
jgi:hypothetical protein